jgi:ribosomal protein L14
LPERFPVRNGGNTAAMPRVIRRRIRRRTDGVDVALDVNAVIAVNDRGAAETQSVQSTSIVQGVAGGAEQRDGERAPHERDDSPEEER